MNHIYQTLKALSTIQSVSGAEGKMAEKIASLMAPYCTSTEVDALGNLICKRHTDDALCTLLLCAHMDEIGFVVTDADEAGFLCVAPLGGHRPETCAYSRVKTESGIPGLLVPPHDTKAEDLDVKKYLVDIGANNRKDALSRVKPGDRLTTVGDLVRLKNHRVTCRALDNKIGVAVLLECARLICESGSVPAYNLVFVFSVQEEVGLRGAGSAAWAVAPDVCINVDTTHAFDMPGARGSVKLSQGVAVKYKDRSVLCDRGMIAKIHAVAAEKHIKTQVEILTEGGTDTSVIQQSRAGVPSAALSVPVRYLHTDAECASLRDAHDAATLLCALCQQSF